MKIKYRIDKFFILSFLVVSLTLTIGCGLQNSFRRPKTKKINSGKSEHWQEPMLAVRTGYLRAYSAWYADHQTLLERADEMPDILNKISKRLLDHLKFMKQFMYEKEALLLQTEFVNKYEAMMATAFKGANPEVMRRRLNRLESRLRSQFSPGRIPLKHPEASAKEHEE